MNQMSARRDLPTDVRHVAFAGDWHANSAFARRVIASVELEVDAVVHTGDFLYDANPTFIHAVSQAAGRAGVIVAFVDGNHDNHTWLNKQPRSADGSVQIAEHVWWLPRGHRWTWTGVRFVAVGGAVSIDRPTRQAYMRAGAETCWWPGEELSEADIGAVIAGGPADVMVTHDAPWGVTIPGIAENEHLWDPAMLAESKEHQKLLLRAVEAVKPAWLWHGHFHTRYRDFLTLPDGHRVVVNGLGHEGTGRVLNLNFVDLTNLVSAAGAGS